MSSSSCAMITQNRNGSWVKTPLDPSDQVFAWLDLFNRLEELGLKAKKIWHEHVDVDDSKLGLVVARTEVDFFGSLMPFESGEHKRGKFS